jgi:NTP pyrophosphatase (non-canonical NTP hydrolase)
MQKLHLSQKIMVRSTMPRLPQAAGACSGSVAELFTETGEGETIMHIKDLEAATAKWHGRKFAHGQVVLADTLEKLGEEYGELQGAMWRSDCFGTVEEAADMVIVLTHIVRYYGGIGSLETAIKKKLAEINRRLETQDLQEVCETCEKPWGSNSNCHVCWEGK